MKLKALTGLIIFSLSCSGLSAAPGGVSIESKSVSVGGKSFSVRVVKAPLDKFKPKVGLAKGKVGATESLSGIVKRYSAVAGINGCFFNAYTKSSIKPPYHHLATDGQFVHVGNTGTTIGFDANGDYRMEALKVKIKGSLNESWTYPNNWYAYLLNHPVENNTTAIIYNKYWVGSTTPGAGSQVAVRNGTVCSSTTGGVSVPTDGFAVLFSGDEQKLADRLNKGEACEYKLEFDSDDPEFWADVQEAIGCGPRLVANGEVCADPTAEGFSSSKILSMSGQRSAVGVTRNKVLLLVTCSGATVKQAAGVMKALGAHDAMILDGGASSCLWANGKHVTNPGRELSNALLVVKR